MAHHNGDDVPALKPHSKKSHRVYGDPLEGMQPGDRVNGDLLMRRVAYTSGYRMADVQMILMHIFDPEYGALAEICMNRHMEVYLHGLGAFKPKVKRHPHHARNPALKGRVLRELSFKVAQAAKRRWSSPDNVYYAKSKELYEAQASQRKAVLDHLRAEGIKDS